jgi:hypothetical protein
MRGGQEGGATISDGKVGIAYIEELRFANYVARLQTKINSEFDKQFKCYLKSAGIKIDENLFKIHLPDPQNFKIYKQAEVDEKMIANYSNVKEVKELSARFKLKHYLGLSEDSLQENEVMQKQELGIPDGGINENFDDIRMMYDPKWIENRPDIKVPENYDDHSGGDTPPEEETEDKPDEGDGKEDLASSEKEAKSEPEDKAEDMSLDDLKAEISK